MEKPTATYRERQIEVRRDFALYADRVEIACHWRLRQSFTATVRLDQLAPEYKLIRIRSRLYKLGMGMAFLGIVFSILSHFMPGAGKLPGVFPASFAVGVAGIALMAFTYRPVRFARFKNSEGRSALDVAETGPDKRQFEEFLKKIQQQIRRAG